MFHNMWEKKINKPSNLSIDIIFWKVITRILIHSFIQQKFTKHLLCARSKSYRGEHKRQDWKLHETNILVGKTEINYWLCDGSFVWVVVSGFL